MSDVDKVAELLREAADAVEQAELPETLQRDAFKLAVQLLSSDGTTTSRRGKAQPPLPTQDEPVDEEHGGVDDGDFFDTLAANAGVPVEILTDTYHLDGDGLPQLNLRGQDLGDSKKARVEAIALLMAGAYRLGLRKELPASTVRAIAKSFGALDRNFADHIRGLSTYISYTGPKKKRVIDLKPAGETEYRKRLEIET